jgi:hypothetical protein
VNCVLPNIKVPDLCQKLQSAAWSPACEAIPRPSVSASDKISVLPTSRDQYIIVNLWIFKIFRQDSRSQYCIDTLSFDWRCSTLIHEYTWKKPVRLLPHEALKAYHHRPINLFNLFAKMQGWEPLLHVQHTLAKQMAVRKLQTKPNEHLRCTTQFVWRQE